MRQSATTLEPEMSDEELSYLKNHLKTGNFEQLLEIGTAAGGTLCEMMSAYESETRPQFSVVDPMNYFPDQLSIVESNLSQNNLDPKSVIFLLGRSHNLFQEAKRDKKHFDFILIDGSHKILHVTQDIQWSSLLTVGGSIFFHDYHPNTPGVKTSVDHFLKKNKNYEIIKQVGTIMAIRKVSPSNRFEVSALDMVRAQIIRPIHQLRRSLKKRLG